MANSDDAVTENMGRRIDNGKEWQKGSGGTIKERVIDWGKDGPFPGEPSKLWRKFDGKLKRKVECTIIFPPAGHSPVTGQP